MSTVLTPGEGPADDPPADRRGRAAWGSIARFGGASGVWLFGAALAVASAVIFVALILPMTPYAGSQLPWLFFVVAFGLAEVGVISFPVRPHAVTISLAVFPLVIGFYFADPAALVLTQLVGSAAALIVVRREAPARLAFSLALSSLCTSLAIVVFRAIAPPVLDTAVATWLAAFAATSVVVLISTSAITVETSLTRRRAQPDAWRAGLLLGLLAAAVNTSLALLAVEFMRRNPEDFWLVLAPALVAILGYRAFAVQREREARIEFLYEKATILSRPPDGSDPLIEVLSLTRDRLDAGVAEIVLGPGAGRPRPTRTRVGPGSARESATAIDPDRFAEVMAGLPADGNVPEPLHPGPLRALWDRLRQPRRSAEVVVPIRVEDKVVGVLRVAGRTTHRGTFGPEEVRMIEALGRQASVALHNAGLLASLAEALASVTRLAAAIDASDDAIMELAPDGTIRAWNPAAERLYGYAAEEFAGRSVTGFVPPDRLEQASARIGTLTAGGRVLGVQTEIIRKDGSRVPVSASVSPIADPAGTVVGISATVRDESAQREADAALRASEDRFRRVFQDSPIGMALTDNDLRWSAVNEALCRMLDRPETELVGLRFDALVHPDDVERADRLVDDSLAGDNSAGFSTERRYETPSGRIVWARVTSRPLVDTPAGGARWIEVVEDVTERHQASERARDTEARLHRAVAVFTAVREPASVLRAVLVAARDLLDAEFAAIGVLSEDGTEFVDLQFEGVDDATAAAVGRRPEGHGLLGLAGPQTGAIRVREVARHPASVGVPAGHPVIGSFIAVPIVFEGRLVARLYAGNKREGAEFSAEDEGVATALAAQAAVVLENARMNARTLALVEELDRANADLRRASDAKSSFLGTVSHELRTPLHSILVAAELVSDPMFGPLNEERARDLGATIQGSGRHLLGLIDDMVDLARIEAGRIDLRIVRLPLAPMLGEIRREVGPLARDRGIAFECACEPDLMIHADPLRIRQVLVNLLVNAVKFCEPGGRVWVDVQVTPEQVEIAVHDTGVGIRHEDLERIFEPFDQVSEVVAPGAGLGLAIARRLVHLHGGRLTATSAHGMGSTFTVSLPEHSQIPEGTGAWARREPTLPPRLPDSTILVVDDDLTSLGLVADVLTRSGYLVRTATHLAEALASCADHAPCLVLLDVRLGAENGLDLARRLRADPATHALPILALSADAMQHDVERALEAGCNGHVAKPVVARELLGRIHALLDQAAGTEPDEDAPGAPTSAGGPAA